jgi:hypothetical protein
MKRVPILVYGLPRKETTICQTLHHRPRVRTVFEFHLLSEIYLCPRHSQQILKEFELKMMDIRPIDVRICGFCRSAAEWLVLCRRTKDSDTLMKFVEKTSPILRPSRISKYLRLYLCNRHCVPLVTPDLLLKALRPPIER